MYLKEVKIQKSVQNSEPKIPDNRSFLPSTKAEIRLGFARHRESIDIGKKFGDESLMNIIFPSPDYSNGYDNAMIVRAVNWAKNDIG